MLDSVGEFFKIAIIGAGYMSKEHIKVFKTLDNVLVTGIYSRTKSRAELLASEFDIRGVYDSIEELYMKTKADMVIISVPELSTKEVCEVAFLFPWVCLIEKPVGYNLENAESIYKLSEIQKAKVFVALNRRHYSSTRIIQEDLAKHVEPRVVHVNDQENPLVALEGGTPKLVVDYWMYANSIHIIDYFNLLCRGELLDVVNINKYESYSSFYLLSKLCYSSGDIGIYEAVWNGPGPWIVSVTTPKKRWELRPLEELRVLEYKSRKPYFVEPHHWDKEFKPGLRLQAEESLKMLRGEDHQLPSIFEALKTMRLINKIYGV
jgi:predicted dehydrogenase